MVKRLFDLVSAILGLLLLSGPILLLYLLACVDTGANGLFLQTRIGRYGKPFTIYKIRTLHSKTGRVSAVGSLLRTWKLDELPQLWNVLMGEMSVVGPRPDVPGYADLLEGEDRVVLRLRPGLTGPATLKFKNEEELLAVQPDPERYNREVIWPEKVRMNVAYYYNRSFWGDLGVVVKTFFNW